jgi:hypothetical protein
MKKKNRLFLYILMFLIICTLGFTNKFRVVYIKPSNGGQIYNNELKKYPEILVVNSLIPVEQKPEVGLFDINVSIKFHIILADKVRGVNPDIIKASRQAIYDYYCSEAKFSHYNGFSVDNDMLIFDIKEIKNNTWGVYFHEKSKEDKTYPMGYSFLTVEKLQSGSYKGYVSPHGSPLNRVNETY